jgi:hypothetical protein
MPAIELDAFEAFLDATSMADRELSGREVGFVLRHLYDAGWRITREPEPVIEPPAPIVPITSSHPERQDWLPANCVGLWVKLNTGVFVPLVNEFELKIWTSEGLILIEAKTEEDAARLFDASPGDFSIERFMYSGETYEYRSDQLPF